MLVGFVIAFLVPSTTARVACLVPIMLGIIAAFGVSKKSAFASMLMITTTQTASIWNVGIKTAAAQNMVAIGFIEKTLQKTITWLEWLIAAAPFAILMSIALYFVMTRMMPPEVKDVPGGREAIRKSLADLGPMKASEKKLLAISLTLLAFWATEGVLHKFDTSSDHDRGGRADVPARHRHHDLEGGAAQDPVGHDRAVRHRHQPRHRAAADQGRGVARRYRGRPVRAQAGDRAVHPRRA